MPKMIVSIDDIVTMKFDLTKGQTSLGRRPYNDIVFDHLSVSGEHAVLQMLGKEVHLEDLNSTNGTYVNGKAVTKQQLLNNDIVKIGKYKIKFVNDVTDAGFEKTMPIPSASMMALAARPVAQSAPDAAVVTNGNAVIRVMSGEPAGREVPLVKEVTTLGKPGVAVAAITKRPDGFVIVHVEGSHRPSLNGALIGAEPQDLKDGDVLELAGIQMQFVQR
jgi:hypothetical protein